MSITEPHNVLLNFAVISLEIVHILRMNCWTEDISYLPTSGTAKCDLPALNESLNAYDLTLPRPNDAYKIITILVNVRHPHRSYRSRSCLSEIEDDIQIQVVNSSPTDQDNNHYIHILPQ